MEITHQISLKLKELQSEMLPPAVILSIETEVQRWEKELNDSAQGQLVAFVNKRLTKPFIAKHFNKVYRKRKSTAPVQEGF